MMIIGRVRRRGDAISARSVRHARLHLGRATAAGTEGFVSQGEAVGSGARLRVGADEHVTVTHRGIGSPHLWPKDMPRIDASKHALTTYESNFIQATINPYKDAPINDEDKQAYVESLVLQEVIEYEGIAREALIVSALLEDSIINLSTVDPIGRLSKQYLDKGVAIALKDLDIEGLDHLVVRVPDELVLSKTLHGKFDDALVRCAGALEELCSANKIQSYGFALPSFHDSSACLEQLVESSLLRLSETHPRFASLQLPMSLTSALIPVPAVLAEFKKSRDIAILGEKAFEATLDNGKPLSLRTYRSHIGEDVALLLKSAFNLAISIERKYMEKILPEHSNLSLPAAEDVAWAHILANQHAQFDNFEEWVYIRETQILPRFEVTVKQFDAHEDLKEFGFAYSMALRELLKCFSASVELADAERTANLLTALRTEKLVDANESLEAITVNAVISSGADVVLVQEQFGKDPTPPVGTYSPAQLASIHSTARKFLHVG